MSFETKHNLDADTVDTVEQLIQVNLDSSEGFQQGAKLVSDPAIEELFVSLAQDRQKNADVLREQIAASGETSRAEGSYAAALHRLWLDLRGKMAGGDAKVILSEAERGEDYIKHAYEEALKHSPGTALNDVLIGQYADVKAQHDRVRDLRDQYIENSKS